MPILCSWDLDEAGRVCLRSSGSECLAQPRMGDWQSEQWRGSIPRLMSFTVRSWSRMVARWHPHPLMSAFAWKAARHLRPPRKCWWAMSTSWQPCWSVFSWSGPSAARWYGGDERATREPPKMRLTALSSIHIGISDWPAAGSKMVPTWSCFIRGWSPFGVSS